ncbi:octopamine receptor 1-like [Mya arenaria]|uniref:octopamine receptor 1-like n=1 Tax=Mya arenaria TaxID=6604 RepID=UPI0022E87E4E|nr:octopamine receptor 1-like [Mya arenaria]
MTQCCLLSEFNYVEMEGVDMSCLNGTVYQSDGNTQLVVAKTVLFSLIDLAVVLGNSLVIAAVFTTRKLRTVTNIFIVSLACADLLIGFAVLPFSISLEVDEWLWGQVWCSMWLAIDVWLCTASILSLCAISFDRYIAVTHPIKYPTIMSASRGRWLVASVWILSFVICLPPLLGWNDSSMHRKTSSTFLNELQRSFSLLNRSSLNQANMQDILPGPQQDIVFNLTGDDYLDGLFSNINTTENCSEEKVMCELTTTTGYRIYAALGSFFIPMLVMVFFYFRIYLTAIRTAASIRRGVLTTKISNDISQPNGYGEDEMYLRVHRGGSSSSSRKTAKHCDLGVSCRTLNSDTASRSPRLAAKRSPCNTLNNIESSERSVFKCSRDDNLVKTNGENEKSLNGVSGVNRFVMPVARQICRSKRRPEKLTSDITELEMLSKHNDNGHPAINGLTPNISPLTSKSSSPNSPRRCKLLIRETKAISVKGHARKFKREAKAAKTLAIIVGAFIICWCPFFTIYLMGAFCHECVSELVFAVFFWLGYCNSALNPCIYALFARDFRSAFKRLVLCRRRKGFTHATRADFVTGITRNRYAAPHHDKDSGESDF